MSKKKKPPIHHRPHKVHNAFSWLEHNWHSLCGMTYIIIVLCDFVIFPSLYQITNMELTPERQVALATQFKDGTSQVQAFVALRQERNWVPLTLGQNGLFHVAFGSILGVGIWSRNRKQNTEALDSLTTHIQNLSTNSNSITSLPINSITTLSQKPIANVTIGTTPNITSP